MNKPILLFLGDLQVNIYIHLTTCKTPVMTADLAICFYLSIIVSSRNTTSIYATHATNHRQSWKLNRVASVMDYDLRRFCAAFNVYERTFYSSINSCRVEITQNIISLHHKNSFLQRLSPKPPVAGDPHYSPQLLHQNLSSNGLQTTERKKVWSGCGQQCTVIQHGTSLSDQPLKGQIPDRDTYVTRIEKFRLACIRQKQV